VAAAGRGVVRGASVIIGAGVESAHQLHGSSCAAPTIPTAAMRPGARTTAERHPTAVRQSVGEISVVSTVYIALRVSISSR
jgi:hypothetical protein